MKNCIYCNYDKLAKFGKRNGIQMYRCNNCGKHFTENSNSKRNLIINGEKYCKICDSFKPLSEYFHKKGKPRSICKSCYQIKNNSRYSAYKLNENEFTILLNNQNNQCAICNVEFKSNRNTFIDHDHATGNIRELLCPKCNNLLGACGDNVMILQSAINYLSKHMTINKKIVSCLK